MKTKGYIAFEASNEELIWNDDNQSCIFPTLKAVKQGIQDTLDEPYASDGDRDVSFGESEGVTYKDYTIYHIEKVSS